MFIAKLSEYASATYMCVCRQEWVELGSQTSASSIVLTPEQRHRRSLYFQPAPATLAGAAPQRTAAVTPVEVQAWIARELQAVTLEQDVRLLCQVVLGSLAAAAQSLTNTGTRYFASCQDLQFCHHRIISPPLADHASSRVLLVEVLHESQSGSTTQVKTCTLQACCSQ